jgi:GNAT superfamily N-acetyltransferase
MWDDSIPLARQHHLEQKYKEVFNPKRGLYETLEAVQVLRLYSYRDDSFDGTWWLRGYHAFTVIEHPHMDCKIAYQDTVYVRPQERGFASGKFLLWVDAELAKESVNKIVRFVPVEHDWGNQLERIGYKHVDKVMVLDLSGA